MTLKIRLTRGGTKKRPYYRIVVADSRAPRDGRFIERIGHYNPLLPKDSADRVGFDEDRARYWLGVGARPTDRVARFLSQKGLVEWQRGDNPHKGKPGKKAVERREAKKQAEQDAGGESEAPAPVAETPAQEAPAEQVTAQDAPAEQASAPDAGAEEKTTGEAGA